MFSAEYSSINAFLIGASKLLLKKGVRRTARGKPSVELPFPFLFKIKNPTSRLILLPERNWKPAGAYAESLWLASGRNDLALMRPYLKKLTEFSDNGSFIRGGYGPRLRHYDGSEIDYCIDQFYTPNIRAVDQFRFVTDSFKADSQTRRAVLTIQDPVKDQFDLSGKLKNTKDFPCTISLQLIKNSSTNKLDMFVNMRSNDLIWGAGGVNIFNFTFMQEYFSAILGLEIGEYYHCSNCLHFYDHHLDMVKSLASYDTFKEPPVFIYNKAYRSLEAFDELVKKLLEEVLALRPAMTLAEIPDFKGDFFNDWYKVLFYKRTSQLPSFVNPQLRELFKDLK